MQPAIEPLLNYVKGGPSYALRLMTSSRSEAGDFV